jgi:putative addiction module component (TIGR02574 family)
MNPTPEELIAAAMALTPADRARVAEALLESLRTPEEPEIDDFWVREAERRIDEYEAGRATTIPAEEVLRSIEAKRSQTPRL